MVCDHCGRETKCIVDFYYDLQLCDSCNDRHKRMLWLEKQALAELSSQQEYWESLALNYEYNST